MRVAAPAWGGICVLLGLVGGVVWAKNHAGNDAPSSGRELRILASQEQVLKRLEALEAERLAQHLDDQAEQARTRVTEVPAPGPRERSLDAKAEPPSLPAAAAEEPSPEQLLGGERAQGLLDRAVKAGKWDDSDRVQFRNQFRSLTGQQQAELLRALNVAMNEGKLQFDPAALPI